MASCQKKKYRAIAYYRISKDDGKKRESDSISNQRKLIREYIAAHDDIELVLEKDDDGYTGTNYDRPGFRAVLDAIRSGQVDCVIVKDLSRLGREYIETGRYLEMVFPDQGVRFIAINDDVDSDNHSQSDDILIPVKNLINESYCRELSRKLRAQFRIQRRNGEYLGAFTSYGYRKSEEDKHKLVIDEYPAEVVKSIFSLKLQGYSQQAIADCLNRAGALSPSEYKKQQGSRYKSGFKTKGSGEWTAVSVRRILTNTLYIGELVQGKRGTPNYKVKLMRERKPEEWVVVEHNHEPIIDELMFMTVQKILQRDTRTSPSGEVVKPLAGLAFCPDCGRAMSTRSVTRSGKRFNYYVCSTYKRGKGCSNHGISQEKLETVVFHAIQNQIMAVVEMDKLMEQVTENDYLAVKLRRIDIQIEQKDLEIEKYEDYRAKLYEAMRDDLISREEYQTMRTEYSRRIEDAKSACDVLEAEKAEIQNETTPSRTWMEQFIKYRSISQLNREMVVCMVDRIYVYENGKVHIDFNYRDEMSEAFRLLEAIRKKAV